VPFSFVLVLKSNLIALRRSRLIRTQAIAIAPAVAVPFRPNAHRFYSQEFSVMRSQLLFAANPAFGLYS
jgi:hypothetical protein